MWLKVCGGLILLGVFVGFLTVAPLRIVSFGVQQSTKSRARETEPSIARPPAAMQVSDVPRLQSDAAIRLSPSDFSMPVSFEPNLGQGTARAEFLGRGGGTSVLLTRHGIEFGSEGQKSGSEKSRNIAMRFLSVGQHTAAMRRQELTWRGAERLPGEANYFLGNDPSRWRRHVPQFAVAVAHNVVEGIDAVAYGRAGTLEYDLRVSPGTKPEDLRVAISGADKFLVDADGDLMMASGKREIRMRKPIIYQEIAGTREVGTPESKSQSGGAKKGKKSVVDGEYVLELDGTVGFRVGKYNRNATLVIDPSLSVGYATFMGGAGEDRATSIAVDATGKIYVGGTTTSASTFIETSGLRQGLGGALDYFIAKIDPTKAGPSSLVYLTFIGGSGNEEGGEIAVDASGDVALAGTTTSTDYPVTDSSTLTAGVGGIVVNDATITEIGPTGTTLVYSTLFGGNGNEGTLSTGGIALDAGGDIYVGMDTQSTNLTLAPTTGPGPFRAVYGGGISDGFLAIFRPVLGGSTTHLKYCTYLGIGAHATVTGVAVDAFGNAFLTGYTSDPLGSLETTNGFQTTYGGGTSNAFVMKILPSGNGDSDLSYGTFLGGGAMDQALAITVGQDVPGTAYITGTTTSPDFPVNGTVAPFQSALKGEGNGNANAFIAVIGQQTNGMTVLTYSSYLGGSQSDGGLGIFFAAANVVYVTGSAKSWDFPWMNNLQPFSGDEDAFVVKMDPTSAGPASLVYSTPLGGSAAAGVSATAQGNGIAADSVGNFYVAGATTAGNFPVGGNLSNGMQLTCASCQQTPPLDDAFVVEGLPSDVAMPSISFNVAKVNFGVQPVGSTTVPPGAVAAINTGSAPLSITAVNVTGANAADFSLIGASACMTGPIAPGLKCSFEVGFVGSVVGPEEAFLSFTDDGPAGTQSLALVGVGAGPFAVVSPSAVNFGQQPVNSRSNTFQQVTLTNTGNQPLSFTESLTGPNAAQFPPADASETCATAGNSVLAAGASCVVPFFFAPTTTGTLSAEVVFVDNSGGKNGTQQVVPITGVGTGAAPILAIAPTSVDFGSQPVGITSATQTVTFTNNGSEDLNISSFAITGNSSTSFGYVAKGASACALPSPKLVAGGSCALSVDFSPNAAGATAATLSVTDNAPGSPQGVMLSGTGGTSGISIAPGSVNFATESVGSPSAAVPINVTNTGSSPLTMTISVTGADPGDFTETDTCSENPLGANKNCLIDVTFKPESAGSRSALIQILDSAPGSPQTIPLSGTAVQATASISPATLEPFGAQLAGTTSAAPQNVKITNSGGGAAVLTVSNASLNPSANFTLANNCATGLAAGGSCMMAVTFAPAAPAVNAQCGAAAGIQHSVLSIFDNDPNSPQTMTLSGMAVDYCLVPPGAISATVASGSTGTFTVAAQSEGFAGTITLTCAAAVPQGACTVSQGSLALAGNVASQFQVSVTTTAQSVSTAAGLSRSGREYFGGRGKRAAFLVMSGATLCLAVFIVTLSGKRIRLAHVLQGLAVFFVLGCGVAACGGGGGQGTVTSVGTPSGTYSLTITGTSTTGATRTLGLTLTVQ